MRHPRSGILPERSGACSRSRCAGYGQGHGSDMIERSAENLCAARRLCLRSTRFASCGDCPEGRRSQILHYRTLGARAVRQELCRSPMRLLVKVCHGHCKRGTSGERSSFPARRNSPLRDKRGRDMAWMTGYSPCDVYRGCCPAGLSRIREVQRRRRLPAEMEMVRRANYQKIIPHE